MSQRQAEVSALLLAESARQTQVSIKQQVTADVVAAWVLLDFERLSRTWPGWLAAMTELLTRHHATSADAAALLYRATRQLELGDPGHAALASPPTSEWVTKALGYAAPGVYEKTLRAGGTPQEAQRASLVTTLGTSSRITLDGARVTAIDSARADSRRVRYYRVTDGDPCYFCALSASRGAIYHSEATAGGNANHSFIGEGAFKFHNNCGCTIAPAFGAKPALTGVAAEAARVYSEAVKDIPAGAGMKPRLAAFRKAWDGRQRIPAAQAA